MGTLILNHHIPNDSKLPQKTNQLPMHSSKCCVDQLYIAINLCTQQRNSGKCWAVPHDCNTKRQVRRCPTSASHRRTASIPSREDTPTDLAAFVKLLEVVGSSAGAKVSLMMTSRCLIRIDHHVWLALKSSSQSVHPRLSSSLLQRRHLDWSADYFISTATSFICPRFAPRFLCTVYWYSETKKCIVSTTNTSTSYLN